MYFTLIPPTHELFHFENIKTHYYALADNLHVMGFPRGSRIFCDANVDSMCSSYAHGKILLNVKQHYPHNKHFFM